TRIYTSGKPWTARQIRNGELHLVVTDVTPDLLHLSLQGFALLGAAYNPVVPLHEHDLGYEARLTGFLTFDRRHEALTRFDLLAVGDTYGKMPDGFNDLSGWTRPGRQPLGFAFELVPGDVPADGIPPAGRWYKEMKNYFATGPQ